MWKLLKLCSLLVPILGSGCATMSRDSCCPKEKGAKTLLSWEAGPKDEKEGEKNGDDKGDKKSDDKGDKKSDGDDKKDAPAGDPAASALRPASYLAGKGTGGDGNGKAAEKPANGADMPNGGKPEKKPEKDEIVTDRPDFTEASSTVGKGRIQLEAGYTYSRNREAGIQASHSYPEALLRVGMFADWFELRLGQNFSNTRMLGADGGKSARPAAAVSSTFSNTRALGADGGPFRVSGGEDLYLGTKLGLTEQKKYLPETALILQMTVPTGSKSLTAGKTLPGINYLYGWEINDFLSVGGSTQGNLTVDDDSHTYLEVAQSITVGYSLTEKLGAYTEWFAFFPNGATSPGTSAQHFLNGGFTYKITPLFQLDIRAGKGLSRSADDYFFGAGFAVKY